MPTIRSRWFQLLFLYALAACVQQAGAQTCDCPGCDAWASSAGSDMLSSELSATSESLTQMVGPESTLAEEPALSFNTRGAALTGSTFAAAAPGGYLEPALIRSSIRFRFDAAYDFDRPDRAEFYYTTWDTFGGKNPNPPGVPDPKIDRQELSLYLEHAFNSNFSIYAEVPYVFSNPLRNPNEDGIGDIQAGIKVGLFQDRDQILTFRLNNHIPIPDNGKNWLGTGHYSIEPGFLYQANLTEKWTLQAEVRDWISIGGATNPRQNDTAYAGNVLRYGLGLSYDLIEGHRYRVTPVVEMVGWSVLEGQVFDFNDDLSNRGVVDADGDSIVNLKIGARVANYCGGSVYAGWGTALTDDRWYQDIFRLEYRRFF